jgi:hypothetical protein
MKIASTLAEPIGGDEKAPHCHCRIIHNQGKIRWSMS